MLVLYIVNAATQLLIWRYSFMICFLNIFFFVFFHIVTLTFFDGWEDVNREGLPTMQSYLVINWWSFCFYAGTVFAYGVTSSGKTHTMHVSCWIYNHSEICVTVYAQGLQVALCSGPHDCHWSLLVLPMLINSCMKTEMKTPSKLWLCC